MTAHDHHPSLLGYDERQILVDGCTECEDRAADVDRALGHLDPIQFRRAWRRAFDFDNAANAECIRRAFPARAGLGQERAERMQCDPARPAANAD